LKDSMALLTESMLKEIPFTWTYVGLVFYLLTAFGRVQAIIPGLSSVPIGMASAALMVMAYLVEAPSRGGYGTFSTREEKLLIGLFIVAVLSVPGSVWPGKSFQVVFKNLLPTVAMFIIVAFTTCTLAAIRKVIWLYFAIISILIVAAIKGGISHGSRILEMYDANDLSLVLVCAIPFMALFQKECKGLARFFLLGGIPLTVAVIILSGSRGGFLDCL